MAKAQLPGDNPEKPKYSIRSGFSLPAEKLATDESTTYKYSIYLGPKRYSVLKKMDGDVKEVMNYGWFSSASLTVMSLLMVLGRLEVFAVFVLFLPRFWRSD